jgi:hypothetical protein
MHLFLPYVLYKVLCLSKSCAHTNNCKKNLLKKGRKEKEKEKHRLGTNVRVRGFKAGLLDISSVCIRKVVRQASSVEVFLGPRANAELVPKFHVVLHASHAALPMVTLKISP